MNPRILLSWVLFATIATHSTGAFSVSEFLALALNELEEDVDQQSPQVTVQARRQSQFGAHQIIKQWTRGLQIKLRTYRQIDQSPVPTSSTPTEVPSELMTASSSSDEPSLLLLGNETFAPSSVKSISPSLVPSLSAPPSALATMDPSTKPSSVPVVSFPTSKPTSKKFAKKNEKHRNHKSKKETKSKKLKKKDSTNSPAAAPTVAPTESFVPSLIPSATPTERPPTMNQTASMIADFKTIANGTYSGVEISLFEAIHDAYIFNATWQLHTSNEFPPKDPPLINFNETMVVAIYRGSMPSTGYGVEILYVIEKASTVEVYYRTTDPPPDAMTGQAFTQPHHLIEVPASTKEVTFFKLI